MQIIFVKNKKSGFFSPAFSFYIVHCPFVHLFTIYGQSSIHFVHELTKSNESFRNPVQFGYLTKTDRECIDIGPIIHRCVRHGGLSVSGSKNEIFVCFCKFCVFLYFNENGEKEVKISGKRRKKVRRLAYMKNLLYLCSRFFD